MAKQSRYSYLVGKRIELVHMADPYTSLPMGLQGVVFGVDDMGTIEVNWDNGSMLGLIPEAGDSWKVLS